MMKRYFPIWLSALFAVSVLAGCQNKGPDVSYVEGVVTFDGQPLSKAQVVFIPVTDAGIAASGFTDNNGVYKLTSLRGGAKDAGAMPGEYTVTFSRDKDEPSSFRDEDSPEGKVKMPVYESLIPMKYNDPKASSLTATVEKKKNKIDFTLEK